MVWCDLEVASAGSRRGRWRALSAASLLLILPTAQSIANDAALRRLATAPIRLITAPNSTLIPPAAVRSMARRAELLGKPVSGPAIKRLADLVRDWYRRNGYIANELVRVAVVEEGRCELELEEFIVDGQPVDISFVKEEVIVPTSEDGDGEAGTMAYRAYRKKMSRNRSLKDKALPRSEMNSTLVRAEGRTSPRAVAEAMGLRPGEPFRWEQWRWEKVRRSGLFEDVEKRVVKPLGAEGEDGGAVRVDLLAREAPCRTLDYGVTKSLYTGGWEGEMSFEHRNVLGGGERAGVVVRRGARDPEPSISVRISDQKLGCRRGYSVDLFNEYIGDGVGRGAADAVPDKQGRGAGRYAGAARRWWKGKATPADAGPEDGAAPGDLPPASAAAATTEAPPSAAEATTASPTTLLARRGATVRLDGPLDGLVPDSAASASLERTSTTDGIAETIGSTSVDVGPFVSDLPFDVRHSLRANVACGTRFRAATTKATAGLWNFGGSGGRLLNLLPWRGGSEDGAASDAPPFPDETSPPRPTLLPFSSATLDMREVLPLTEGAGRRPPAVLALRNVLTVSSKSLPRHEANAIGNAASVRGYGSGCNGPLSAALTGTAEVRMPVAATVRGKVLEPTVVLFGDYMYGAPAAEGGIRDCRFGRVSVGAGLRSSLQGIPIKYDVSYSGEGKISASFGIGHDFDV